MESEGNDLEKSDDESKLIGEVVENAEVIGFLLPNINSTVEDQSLTSANHISGSLSVNEVDSDLLQSETLQLVDESDTYIETISDQLDGQNVAVQLIDGSTAFIRTTQKDGIQTVQLQDGTTAYISHTLDLEEFASGVLDAVPSEDLPNIELEKKPLTAGGNGPRTTKALTLGEKAFRCKYEGCDRLYTTQHHLRVHERTHTGIRPFKCASCKKEFATGYSLKSHTRVHTGEKPYKCSDYCGKAFKTSGDLQKHLRTHTGERPFKCPYNGCDRSFTTSNIRKVHMRIHTGERPYVCPVESCDRTFASATNYKNHLRIHTGEKPYVCVVKGCGKKFTEYSSLYKHNVVHTPAKPYVCDLCGRNYRQTSTLSMHRRSAHGITDTADLGDHIIPPQVIEEVELHSESEDNNQVQDEDCQRIQVMVVDSNGDSQTLQISKDTSELMLEQEVQLQLTGEHSGI